MNDQEKSSPDHRLHMLLEERGSELISLMHERLVGDYLSELLTNRKIENPTYSLRSLARDLHLDATDLSKVLRYQKFLSPKTVRRVVDTLSLSSSIAKILVASSALR